MTIDLADHETGAGYGGDYAADLAQLQKRLAHVLVAHIVHKRRAMIVLEGWDAAGKGGVIQRLTAGWDPRHCSVWPIGTPTVEERSRHFLWRFWQRLPADGTIAVFDRSWYGRVLIERAEQLIAEKVWRRAYDEINEFEAQQADSGTTIVKLFLHITQAEQDRRLLHRLDHPWKRWKTGLDDYHNRSLRADYLAAMHDMFKHTDTRWAPWHAVDANNKPAARIAALTIVADRLEAAVDMTPPPLDPEVEKTARAALKD